MSSKLAKLASSCFFNSLIRLRNSPTSLQNWWKVAVARYLLSYVHPLYGI